MVVNSARAAAAATLASFHAGHAVQFFATDDSLVKSVGEFVRVGIEANATCIVVATPGHRAGIEAHLRAAGLDPVTLAAEYRFIALDARATLGGFMRNGRPDRERFHQLADQLIRQAAARGQPVWAVGEMVNVLALDGNIEACLQLEELWNEVTRLHPLTLFCVYDLSTQSAGLQGKTLAHVCAMHSHALATE